MKRNHWITNTELMELYGVGRNHVHTINTTKHPHWINVIIPMYSKKKISMVNIGYLERLQHFRTFVNDESQQLYFELIELFGSQYEMARYMSDGTKNNIFTWSSFLESSLFYIGAERETILKTQVSKMKIEFIRKARTYLRNINEDVFN